MASPSLREQKKLKTRDALVQAAFELFLEQGFEATSVDAIALRAEVSRRTFFRYFPSKEAVVFPDRDARLERFRALLKLEPGEEPFDAVRRAFTALADEFTRDRREVLLQHRIIAASPLLTAHDAQLDHDWEIAVADALAGRAANKTKRRRAEILAGAVLGAVRATLRSWFAQGGQRDLNKFGAEGLDLLERMFKPDRGASA
jgi:AcrR family transcriptional regulator